jgi:S-adenosylmethionine decarboxylase
MILEHNHLLFQAFVTNDDLFTNSDLENSFNEFLYNLIEEIEMTCLIPPVIKLSYLNAWTGIVGIVTSHISFHFWVDDKFLQLDIYSCNNFDHYKAIESIEKFWKTKNAKAVLIKRKYNDDFKMVSLK